MKEVVKLTKRETEIAELFAWGATKKDVANRLFISERTVENHARNIFDKTGCTKINELSAWWFCTTFHISFDLSPLKQRIIALCFLALILPQIFWNNDTMVRVFRSKTATRTCRVARRKTESDPATADFNV